MMLFSAASLKLTSRHSLAEALIPLLAGFKGLHQFTRVPEILKTPYETR
jgi:hypothetical protein